MHQLVTRAVFTDPIVQLAALCPICALSALNPNAALAALSPALRMFNPAINPNAALLALASVRPVININVTIGVQGALNRRPRA